MKRKANQKSHIPLWSDVSYEVEEISAAHGKTFYKTTVRERQFLRHDLLKVVSNNNNVFENIYIKSCW